MINNYSVVDGMRVILGTFIMQLGGLITLVAMVRPPEYDDQDRQERVRHFFWELVVAHILFAVSGYLYVHYYDLSPLLNSISIFWACVIMTQIFHNWFFEPVVLEEMTDEQRRFRFMVILELMAMVAHLVSTFIYMVARIFRKPYIQISEGTLAEKGQKVDKKGIYSKIKERGKGLWVKFDNKKEEESSD